MAKESRLSRNLDPAGFKLGRVGVDGFRADLLHYHADVLEILAQHGRRGFVADIVRNRAGNGFTDGNYAAPDSSNDPLRTSTILPVTPPFPSSSCARLASAMGNRCAMSGLSFCSLRR